MESKKETKGHEWSRMTWEEAMGTEGDLAPRDRKACRLRCNAGTKWLLNVLLWAALLVGAVLWGRVLADDIDREYRLRSRLIKTESRP